MPATHTAKDKAQAARASAAAGHAASPGGHRAAAEVQQSGTGQVQLPMLGSITFQPRGTTCAGCSG